ncbi:MAG: CotH kinase family protein, partial [Chthoniobacteraceae bacterium]
MTHRLLPFALLFTFATSVRAGDPVISEFMASNQNSFVDEDGAHSDWIEIRNPDATAVSLNGWFLTDTATNKSKWTFPNLTLAGNSYLLVWASSKDRRVVGQPLHTNFSLSASGEYLALVKPDGVTVTTEFAPEYLPQFADISYGTSTTSNDVTLIDKPTATRAFVPADNALGATWRAAAFDDAAWFAGTFAVGFMNYVNPSNPNLQTDLGIDLKALVPAIGGTGRNSYSRAHFTIANPALVTKLVLKMNYDDGFHAWINAGSVANSPAAPAEGALVFNSPAGQTHAPGVFDTFDISAKINTLATGDNVLALQTLNTNTTSSDLFVSPQLIASIDTGAPGLTGYFATATPAVANGGPNTIQLPQTVAASRASGPFTAAFSLTLTGAIAGQEIRYVISDPSGAGAVLAQPTATSTLYSALINIATSKLIRAAIFNTGNGQKSSAATLQYLLLETGGANNTSNFTSNLPILVADDHGAGQPVDGANGLYTTSLFYVHDLVAGAASLTSTPVAFSRAGIRVRGSSSSGFPKKSYGLELRDEVDGDRDVPLLGLASDSDWVLNGPWLFDDTFIHNAFINEISRQCGRWAPRTKFAEMFMNQNGGKLDYTDYVGVYVLTEKIKSNNDRVDITPIEPGDNSGDAVTGGYIFKVDRNDPDEVVWTTPGGVGLVLVEPDPQLDTPQQISYIQSYTQTFDTTLSTERNANFTTRNYRNYMDTAAWVDHHILNSIAYNVDALRLSAYFFKDRGKRINAGPIWDFDRALGSDDGRDATPNSWVNIEYFFTLGWWGHVFRDPDFVQAWVDRWVQLRAGPLATSNLHALADAQGAQIGNAAGARDAAKWPDNAATGGIYLNEITAMKSWLGTRATWIDSQMPAAPAANVATGIVSAGTAVTLSGSGGTIRYTINGTDPRPGGGSTPGTGTAYGGPITITQTTVITARRQLPSTTTVFTGQGAIGINWSASLTRVYLVNEFFATVTDIAVSEINFNPLGPTPAESLAVPGVTADEFEFVEIRNIGARKVNLFELRFPDTRPFKELKLAPFTLNPGDRAFVVKNRAAFEARYGTAQTAKIVGEWSEGSLD